MLSCLESSHDHPRCLPPRPQNTWIGGETPGAQMGTRRHRVPDGWRAHSRTGRFAAYPGVRRTHSASDSGDAQPSARADPMNDNSARRTSWIRRLREPSLVFGAILAAAWLAPLASGWSLMLQSVLGAGAVLVIIRGAVRDGVAPSEVGLRADNLFVSSLLLLLTVVPLAAVHLLVGKPGLRWSRVPTYLVWRSFSSSSSSPVLGDTSCNRRCR